MPYEHTSAPFSSLFSFWYRDRHVRLAAVLSVVLILVLPAFGYWSSGTFPRFDNMARLGCIRGDVVLGTMLFVADLAIACSYGVIPFILVLACAHVWRVLPDVLRQNALWWGLFILCCGATHAVDALIIFDGRWYIASAITKVLTAIVSLRSALLTRQTIWEVVDVLVLRRKAEGRVQDLQKALTEMREELNRGA